MTNTCSRYMQQIFAHYIDQFEKINNAKHREYYKWQITKRFHDEMDSTLNASAEEFPTKLYEMKKLSDNLIDSYTQPFLGLVKFAEREPENVREMFRKLYSDDGGNISQRLKRVQEFLVKSHRLRDKYYPDSYLYKDDMHSVTGYLFLYDPDHNYIFKAVHARKFADCVEFYEDWGTGDTVKLDVYYRMCDELVEAVKANRELMAVDASRFENDWGENADTFYPDPEKHLLAFDLIYCCSTYGLFDGISFVRPKSKERQLMQGRKEKALQFSRNLEKARERLQELETAKEYVNSLYFAGATVHHKKYGDGIIKRNSGTIITVEFPEIGEKQLGTFISAANGIIIMDADGYADRIGSYRELLKNESSIKNGLSYAEKEFAPYAEYLD